MTGVVLGLGNTIDHEIELDVRVLERLVDDLGVRADELDVDLPIRSERDLLRVLLAFLADGAGGERYVEVEQVVGDFSRRRRPVTALGGTPVRAALNLARVGIASTVHLVAGDEVRVGSTVLAAPRSNRVILVHDPANRVLDLGPDLPAALGGAVVLLVSGLNALRDEDVARERTAELVAMVQEHLDASGLVLDEDGGFHQPGLGAFVARALAPVLSVHSLNEDELQAYVGRAVDLTDPSDVADALTALRTALPAPVLVVHTRLWVVAVGPGATRYAAHLAGGAAMAAARYIHGDTFTAADQERVATTPVAERSRGLADHIGARLTEGACVVATHVQDGPGATTVGLGDAFVAGFIASYARATGVVTPAL